MKDITATLPAADVTNGRNLSGDKELIRAFSVIAKDPRTGEPCELIAARYWMSRSRSASRVYCTIWVHAKPYCCGHGWAGGYGYDRKSAALQAAINNAGIELSENIAGVGESAERDALKAIARAAGADPLLIVSHG